MFLSCIVHLLRHRLAFCGWKEPQKVAAELKAIYRAESAEATARRLAEFEVGPWGGEFPMIAASWKRNWEQVIPLFACGPEIRKMICTTNAIKNLHMQLRKTLKNRGRFTSDESAVKLIYLALRNIMKKWIEPIRWKAAAGQFAIQFAT